MYDMELDNSRDWYVVYSKRNKEEQAQFHLSTKGIESFFPRLLLSSGSKSRTRIVALFPTIYSCASTWLRMLTM
jgi:hypothetical protein